MCKKLNLYENMCSHCTMQGSTNLVNFLAEATLGNARLLTLETIIICWKLSRQDGSGSRSFLLIIFFWNNLNYKAMFCGPFMSRWMMVHFIILKSVRSHDGVKRKKLVHRKYSNTMFFAKGSPHNENAGERYIIVHTTDIDFCPILRNLFLTVYLYYNFFVFCFSSFHCCW